jgi:hypothetical protein
MIRQQIYREKGGFITNPLSVEYLQRLSLTQSDASSACVLTMCGTPLLYVPPATSELHRENVKGKLKEQFLLWKELRLVDTIDPDNIGYTHSGIPVVFPSDSCVRKETFGGDEGVEVTAGVLRVTDMGRARASGKWTYLIDFYALMERLYRKEKMTVF